MFVLKRLAFTTMATLNPEQLSSLQNFIVNDPAEIRGFTEVEVDEAEGTFTFTFLEESGEQLHAIQIDTEGEVFDQ